MAAPPTSTGRAEERAQELAMRFRRPDGKTAKLVLGPVDFSEEPEHDPVVGQPLTLAAARRLAADISRERARGKDVVADQKAAKLRAMVDQADRPAKAFASAVGDFAEHHAKKRKTGKATARLLGVMPGMDRWCRAASSAGRPKRRRDRRPRRLHRGRGGQEARHPAAGHQERRSVRIPGSPRLQRAVDHVHLAPPPPESRG